MKKFAYLTIDDAPSKEFRKKVDFLYSQKIPAIFFCRGSNLKEHKLEAVYAIEKGFVIGNHSYYHPRCSRLQPSEIFVEIEKTEKLIDEAYKLAGINRPMKLFRFPYGDKGFGSNFETYKHNKHSLLIQKFLKNKKFQQPKFQEINYSWYKKAKLHKDRDIVWTYDTHDWRFYRKFDKLTDIYNRMAEDLPDQGRGLNCSGSKDIILMHDHPDTFSSFQKIIKKLLKTGITFELPRM